jgi:hypothetical protein
MPRFDGKALFAEATCAVPFALAKTSLRRQTSQPWGVRPKSGHELIKKEEWDEIEAFIASGSWLQELPALESDKTDPLLQQLPCGWGAFMMGFDFHLTSEGPKLIEVNTNAGGLATVFERLHMLQEKFVNAVKKEFVAATGKASAPSLVCIVDVAVQTQRLFPEMQLFAAILTHAGIPTLVLSPEDLVLTPEHILVTKASQQPVDLVYNRIASDFRLTAPEHAHLRQAAVSMQVVLTPHPAVYARCADKRILTRIQSPLVPRTVLLQTRPLAEWWQERHLWVFKPATGHGSRGVLVGSVDSMQQRDLRNLPPDTIVQQMCDARESTAARQVEGSTSSSPRTRFDVRVYTSGTHIIACTTRHFCGTKMEMASTQSGFRKVLLVETSCFSSGFEAPSDSPSLSILQAKSRADAQVVGSGTSGIGTAVKERVFQTKAHLEEQAQRRRNAQAQTRESLAARTELILRKRIGEMMRAAPIDGKKGLSKKLNRAKRAVIAAAKNKQLGDEAKAEENALQIFMAQLEQELGK